MADIWNQLAQAVPIPAASPMVTAMKAYGTPKTQADFDTSTYGKRPDGSPKGVGFYGEIPIDKGDGKKWVMGEKTITVNIGGKDMMIPSIVPGLTKGELAALSQDQMPQSVVDKAAKHAISRIQTGKSPYIEPNESLYPLPVE